MRALSAWEIDRRRLRPPLEELVKFEFAAPLRARVRVEGEGDGDSRNATTALHSLQAAMLCFYFAVTSAAASRPAAAGQRRSAGTGAVSAAAEAYESRLVTHCDTVKKVRPRSAEFRGRALRPVQAAGGRFLRAPWQ